MPFPRYLLVLLLSLPLLGARAQEAPLRARHEKLPLIAPQVAFLSIRNMPLTEEQRQHADSDPGVWHDVRLVAWKPPIATISGLEGDSKSLTSVYVHILSFPENLRPSVTELAKVIPPSKGSSDSSTLTLPDGRKLEDAKFLWSTPEAVHLSFRGGEGDFAIQQIEWQFLKANQISYRFICFPELTLKGRPEPLKNVQIIAQDANLCRIRHSTGGGPYSISLLPDDVAALVQKHFIAKGIFSDHFEAPPQRRTASTSPAPARVKASPTPAPPPEEVIRIGPARYAKLPIKNREPLRDVTITKIGETIFCYTEAKSPEEERFGSLSELPDGVAEDLGMPLVPTLRAMLSQGLVTRSRSPLFEVVERDTAAGGLADIVGGRLLANVGPGFLAPITDLRRFDGRVITLPKPIAGVSRAYILDRDFAILGSRKFREWWQGESGMPFPEFSNRAEFALAICDENTVLLDGYTGRFTLFGNEHGLMKRAWKIISLGAPTPYAVVETLSGYYFGILAQRQDLAEASMTWPQLVGSKSTPYALKKITDRPLRPGQPILRLADASRAPAFTSPAGARVYPGHYRTLTEKGMPGLLVILQTPQSDGTETASSSDSTESYRSQKQVEIQKVSLEYVSETSSTMLLKLVTDQRERLVERKDDAKGLTLVDEDTWKNRSTSKVHELEKDPDGGVRFTDGERIYDIQRPRIGDAILTVYEVTQDALIRPPR